MDGGGGNAVVTGEAAHISGEKIGAARYNAEMTDEARNDYSNLIYLCGDHHTQVDKQEADFTTSHLLQMKADHEQRVRGAMMEAFAGVGFSELEEATRWIVQSEPSSSSYDFSLIPPEDKIRRNELDSGARMVITQGLSLAREVHSFIEAVTQTEEDFPERLKAGFLEEYYRLKKDGYGGEDLFDLMCRFAQRGFEEQAKRSAGLAVLVYLFETCEVFEK